MTRRSPKSPVGRLSTLTRSLKGGLPILKILKADISGNHSIKYALNSKSFRSSRRVVIRLSSSNVTQRQQSAPYWFLKVGLDPKTLVLVVKLITRCL